MPVANPRTVQAGRLAEWTRCRKNQRDLVPAGDRDSREAAGRQQGNLSWRSSCALADAGKASMTGISKQLDPEINAPDATKLSAKEPSSLDGQDLSRPTAAAS